MTMQVNDGGTPLVTQETLYNDWKARKGDRVTRHLEIGGSALRHGVVEEAYRSSSSGLGVSLPMYAVRWDDNPGVVERGYLNVDVAREEVLTVDQARAMLSMHGPAPCAVCGSVGMWPTSDYCATCGTRRTP